MKIQLLPSVTLDPIGGKMDSREEREGQSSEAPAKAGTPSSYLLNSGFWPLTPVRVQGKSNLKTPMNSRKSK
jgi:hypothetical protein